MPELSKGRTYGVRYPGGTVVPATHRAQAERVAAEVEGRSIVLILDVALYENDQADLVALRRLGPDVGETEPTVLYIDPDLEQLVMEVIAHYPASKLTKDGVHGLAATAAIATVEMWLLAPPKGTPRCLISP